MFKSEVKQTNECLDLLDGVYKCLSFLGLFGIG